MDIRLIMLMVFMMMKGVLLMLLCSNLLHSEVSVANQKTSSSPGKRRRIYHRKEKQIKTSFLTQDAAPENEWPPVRSH